MSVIENNALLFIDDPDDFLGQYRIVAIALERKLVCMTKVCGLGPDLLPLNQRRLSKFEWVSLERLRLLEDSEALRRIDVFPLPHLMKDASSLTAAQAKRFATRCAAMEDFMLHQKLGAALLSKSGLGPLVREAQKRSGLARPSIYRLLRLLCAHGFVQSSLNPAFDLCGRAGEPRPFVVGAKRVGRPTTKEKLGEPVEHPQVRVTAPVRERVLALAKALRKPGMSDSTLYELVAERLFVSQYRVEGDRRIAIWPAQGSFLNRRQFRHILASGFTAAERLLARTTLGHAKRNYRGLSGCAWDSVFGPNHAYAIDSTIGDIYLRSSIDRNQIIGRPVLYILVDIWSTAVVGFYLCLTGPSWATAQVALFNTVSNPALQAELWGHQPGLGLFPSPAIPAALWADRGEYLSLGGRDTARQLGFEMVHTESRRPDLRGTVEVHHRMVKDVQLDFLPGAMNARRKELELRRSTAHESAMTLREYMNVLQAVFLAHNLTANRSDRLTAEMIALGIDGTPAGLWAFGHGIGRAYKKAIPHDKLIRSLLPTWEMKIRKNGLYLGALPYEPESGSVTQWTETARNFGTLTTAAHYYPGAAARIWWPRPDGHLLDLRLAQRAPITADTLFDEWADSLAIKRMRGADAEYQRLMANISLRIQMRDIASHAKAAVELAQRDDGSAAGDSHRKAREDQIRSQTTAGTAQEASSDAIDAHRAAVDAAHAEMMQSLLSKS